MALVMACIAAPRCQGSRDRHILPLRRDLLAESILLLSLSTRGRPVDRNISDWLRAGSLLQQLANSKKNIALKKQE